jgi:general secretion pathway protein G
LKRSARGFTFIELMMTLAIMAVLATVTVPLAQLGVQRERERDLRLALDQLRQGIDAYKRASDEGRIVPKLGESGYPKSLAELVEGVQDQRSPTRANLYFLRRLPRDPMNPDTTAKPEESWGVRSYASPPDDPREGADVFDVFTKSAQVGLNGVPYRQW